ncbi:MAG: ABC transporter ATP-binding protein [Desulfuromonadia bacterium]
MPPLLSVDRLSCRFPTKRGALFPLQEVSLSIQQQEAVALVGESGCGKSLTAAGIMGLIPPPGEITSGNIRFDGKELIGNEDAIRNVRGRSIGMIFQEPMTSLNPVLTIGFQIAEPLRFHLGLGRREAEDTVLSLLEKVGIPDGKHRFHSYPHQLSGGMRQRVMIAMAIACSPRLLLADEPTTALDVTIQAQILDLIDRLRYETGMGLFLITHDLGIVAQRTERTYVMYTGMIVEEGDTLSVVREPLHPYTIGLLDSLPRRTPPGRPLPVIPGTVRPPYAIHRLCPFIERCPRRFSRCDETLPPLVEAASRRHVRCHLYSP